MLPPSMKPARLHMTTALVMLDGQIVHALTTRASMHPSLQTKILAICHKKIAQKGDNVGVSFYAFFANKNDDPDRLMEVATWWIQTHQLDHFEKAHKIIALIEAEQ